MFIGLVKQFLNKTAFMATCTGVLLVITTGAVQAAANCSITTIPVTNPNNGVVTIDEGQSIDFTGSVGGKGKKTCDWTFDGGVPAGITSDCTVSVSYATAGSYAATLYGTASKENPSTCTANVTVTVNGGGGNNPPVANDDADSTTVDTAVTTNVVANDTDDGTVDATSVVITTVASNGSAVSNGDGTVTYTPDAGWTGVDSYRYTVDDDQGATSNEATVTITVSEPLPPIDPGFAAQTDFKIMMNYELGMHCTGFEFAYCCVLPAYNSILAQVVKPNTIDPNDSSDYARLMAGDPNEGLDALNRQTVVRDMELDSNGNFKKYVLKYWHEAQPRNDGRGKVQSSLLISAAEGNSLMSWNTTFDGASVDGTGKLVTGLYNGADGVMQGNGIPDEPGDNYQNAVWNHLYIFADPAHPTPAGPNLEGHNSTGTTLEADKIRLGVNGHVVFPTDCGAALHPLGPVTQNGDPNGPVVDNTCNGASNGNVLTFSGDTGTVVYTQMKVLENLPIMLTSPDIWEALGLPLTPFEDSVDFFGDPGLLNEDSVRPFVAMKAQMFNYDPAAPSGAGAAVLDGSNNPVIGFGTAPIDIPNCERCHSNPPTGTMIPNSAEESAFPGEMLTVINSPNLAGSQQWLDTQAEYAFWNAYYNIDTGAGDSDWYSRLKSAAISMLTGHDDQHGTSFTARYTLDCATPADPNCGATPQNTRLGHESVICQRCHADNVIAAVKSATHNGGALIKPITEAIHNNHRGTNMAMPDENGIPVGGPITFADSNGRDGGCQGCHPAHRSDGDMDGYPITLAGGNRYALGDNRGANGGCFVGRDVHSNPGKDDDGVETPAHMNAVGQYLVDNVASTGNGIWCTNCHNQLGQEIWKAENMVSLVHGVTGKEADGVTDAVNIRALGSLQAIVNELPGVDLQQAISWLDPKDTGVLGEDDTYAIWNTDPGLCNYVDGYFAGSIDSAHDAAVATVEVNTTSAVACSTGGGSGLISCNAAAFHICGTVDGDGDFSVNAMDFCTTPDCVAAAQATLPPGSVAVPVPMSAATDGRDHWLSPGEPHCADCHAAPFVEQSGNINPYPPFNYPRKASLMRYSKGHQNISCQGCHESIHGLYPVTPNIDTTTYAQAAALNHDGSHGPLKCGTCHEVNGEGVPSHIEDGLLYNGQPIVNDYDAAVAWMHTFTDEADGLGDYCLNCHTDNSGDISSTNKTWTEHAFKGRSSREMMDKAELATLGYVAGDPAHESPENTVCSSCHGDRTRTLERRGCSDKWRNHLIEGRAAESVWEHISTTYAGSTCGW